MDFLLSHGIKQYFVVTGGGAMHLNDSIGHNPNVNVIYHHHEQACAMAAEGYARASGKPGVVCITSGPGTTNALTGVLGAWLDSVPMIVLSGQMKSSTLLSSSSVKLRQLGFQEFNIIDVSKYLTKYSYLITPKSDINNVLLKAIRNATTKRKGPVWLDIPLDVQAKQIYTIPKVFKPNQINTVFSKTELRNIMYKLNRSKRPVLFLGDQINHDGARNLVSSFVSFLKIPTVTEWNCHDILPDSNIYNAGRPGTIGNRNGNYIVQNSDFLLCLGCQLTIRQIGYNWIDFAPKAYKVGIHWDTNEYKKPTVSFNKYLRGNTYYFIKQIIFSGIRSNHSIKKPYNKWSKFLKVTFPVVSEIKRKKGENFSIYLFFEILSKVYRKNTTFVLANGAVCVAGLQVINSRVGRRFFTNAGASSMGYGITASIGVSLATGKRSKVVCIEGDGSLQMNLQELQTIVKNKLDITIFIINNDGYHSIKQTQDSMFQANLRGYVGANEKSGISFPNFKKISTAFDLKYFKIKRFIDLVPILNKVYKSKGPIVCEVFTDPNEVIAPKQTSKLLPNGNFVTPSLERMYPQLIESHHDKIMAKLYAWEQNKGY